MSAEAVEQDVDRQDVPEVETPEPDEPETDGEPETDAPDETEPDDEPNEPEPVQEPEPQLMDDKDIEKAYKQVGKLREHVARRVGDIFGEDAVNLVPCPLCLETPPGFIWPPAIAPFSEETENGLRMMLGLNVRGALKQAPNVERCETCDGLGRVETPSRVPGYDVIDCPSCAATGRILTSNVMPVAQFAATGTGEALVTGPTAIPQALTPELQALKDAGWVIAPPLNPIPSQA